VQAQLALASPVSARWSPEELLAVCDGRVAIPVARAASPAGVIERCVDDIVPLPGYLRAGQECRPAGSC
jgi:hypothetical protein